MEEEKKREPVRLKFLDILWVQSVCVLIAAAAVMILNIASRSICSQLLDVYGGYISGAELEIAEQISRNIVNVIEECLHLK